MLYQFSCDFQEWMMRKDNRQYLHQTKSAGMSPTFRGLKNPADCIFTRDFQNVVLNPTERMKLLVASGQKIHCEPNIPLIRYYNSLNEVYRLAQAYSSEGEIEKAFVLYIRFGSLVLEEMPKHKDYHEFPTHHKFSMMERCKAAMSIAEGFKGRLRRRYDEEAIKWAEELEKLEQEELAKMMMRKPPPVPQLPVKRAAASHGPMPVAAKRGSFEQSSSRHPEIRELGVSAAIRTTPPSPGPSGSNVLAVNPAQNLYPALSFFSKDGASTQQTTETVCVPKDLVPRFLEQARTHTEANVEFCAILAGTRMRGRFIISHILIPKQEGTPNSCTALEEQRIFNYQDTHSLLTVGWIHTHPSQTAFLSSIDLHTQHAYQQMMEDSIAIVCAPSIRTFKVYSLTKAGLSSLANCSESGFHPHENAEEMYQVAQHVAFSDSVKVKVVDLRV